MYKSLFVAARRSTVSSSQLLATAQRTLSTEAVAPVANVNLFDPTRDVTFDADEAFRICKSFCTKDFDQNILIAINLGVDPRKPNQMVRGMASVPHASGKKVVLAVFAQDEKAIDAKNAGADIVGGEELVQDIMKGKIEFTRCIATPDMMKHLAKVARILGPRGLMPNPKLGTVTQDVVAAVQASRQGQIEYRCTKTGIINCAIGRASWPLAKLKENYTAFVRAISDAKPSGAKGTYFQSAYLSSDSVSAKLDIKEYPFRATTL